MMAVHRSAIAKAHDACLGMSFAHLVREINIAWRVACGDCGD